MIETGRGFLVASVLVRNEAYQDIQIRGRFDTYTLGTGFSKRYIRKRITP
ncbi:MAG: hypothetical protein ACFFGZ_08060 [Candidatus Thorarchaeota archaeon]